MGQARSTQLGRSAAEIRGGALRLAQRLRAERPAGAMSSNKICVLSHLYRRGPSTPGDIAATAYQHPQSLTRTFAELQSSGLIARSRSSHDRRAALLSLTDAGRAALIADMNHRDSWLAEALTQLSDVEIDVLRMAAKLMDRLLDADSADPRSVG